jgi:hypothetical protein
MHYTFMLSLFIYICVVIIIDMLFKMRKNLKNMILGLSILLIVQSIIIPISLICQISPSKNSSEDLIYGTAEIIYISFKGIFFGIKSDDDKNYDPINLLPNLQSMV